MRIINEFENLAFKNSLVIHEVNTKQISTMTVTLYLIKLMNIGFYIILMKILMNIGFYINEHEILYKICCSCFKHYIKPEYFTLPANTRPVMGRTRFS